jgi:DMSO/TMAO reductase YedYZ molybdopterin-dependent catalytic subunit
MPLSRRELLQAAPLAAVPLLESTASATQAPPAELNPVPFNGMIVRMAQPMNWETPLVGGTRGPLPLYVRNHFALPNLNPATYRLRVEGLVEQPLELTLADLQQLGQVERELTLECAGNGRVFLTPPVRGLQWGTGGVGTARWTGVPLGAVLDRAKVKPGATDVVLVGADRGPVTSDPPSPGPIHFDRGIPLTKARQDETLLVWGMGGEPLPARHGAPLRAIVGGWYGMASVKWLTKLVLIDKPYEGYWQTVDYAIWQRRGDLPELVPITAMQPKSVLTNLTDGAMVRAGTTVTVHGYAWAGELAVAKVELSVDGGKTWAQALLPGKPVPFRWVPWEAKWTIPASWKGRSVPVVSRCTDTRGNTQPDQRDPDRRTYMINHLIPVEVLVI